MDFPRPSVSPSSLIGDLKDRFGFGGGNQRDGFDQDSYYDEYDDYGYDDANPYDSEEKYGSQADPYDRLEYTTRSTAGRSGRSSYRSSSYGASSSPNLVSASDIRATTSAYGVSNVAVGGSGSQGSAYIPASSEGSSYGSASGTYGTTGETEADHYDVPATGYSDFVSPYKEHSSAGSASSRSAGLDSLFSPSVNSGVSSDPAIHPSALGETEMAKDALVSSANPASSSSSREITLLQPYSYEDVESIARSVRLGNIVVLSLRSTDAALSMRVLDFSFGVASALGAQVDCIADKTFVIIQGKDLSLEERHRLQKQGIL